jgi:hypothetical protein
MPGIFLLRGDDDLVEMTERPYDSEALLQTLLARHPSLLAGDQIDPAQPRRWLLISREMAVPGDDSGDARWALDHLFLDQEGVPTFVEVKRSTDGRLRREVVGQMLDYAANAVKYLPLDTIRTRFQARCDGEGRPAEDVLRDVLGLPEDSEGFWQQVKTNLQAGRIRLVFVADDIPAELRRIVEFLNEQMDPADVLAIEIKQYVGESLRTLVPRVYGLTEEAAQRKAATARASRQWDEPSFFQELERTGTVEVDGARQILAWARPRVTRIYWGKGAQSGSFVPILHHKGRDHQLFAVWTTGTLSLYFYVYASKPPFNSEDKRLALLSRLNAIPGISLPREIINKGPTIALRAIAAPETLRQFQDAFEWMLAEIRAS